jgi:hypothetical protein
MMEQNGKVKQRKGGEGKKKAKKSCNQVIYFYMDKKTHSKAE